MDRTIEEWIRDCEVCSRSDRAVRSNTAPVTTTDWPGRPWEKLAVDIRGPDSSVGQSCRFALVVVDYYSEWVELELMSEVTTSRAIAMFEKLFDREGLPKCVVSDNGPQFVSSAFKTCLAEAGIRHQRTPVHHLMANGLVERFNRTLGGFVETAVRLGGNVARRISDMVRTYNARAQATTGKSPAELLHGRPMRTKLNAVGEPESEGDDIETRRRVENKQIKQAVYADHRRAARREEVMAGEWVRVRKPQARKGEQKFGQPMQVTQRCGLDVSRRLFRE